MCGISFPHICIQPADTVVKTQLQKSDIPRTDGILGGGRLYVDHGELVLHVVHPYVPRLKIVYREFHTVILGEKSYNQGTYATSLGANHITNTIFRCTGQENQFSLLFVGRANMPAYNSMLINHAGDRTSCFFGRCCCRTRFCSGRGC